MSKSRTGGRHILTSIVKRERVLIVEDDRAFELILRIPLEREGFIVDFVEEESVEPNHKGANGS